MKQKGERIVLAHGTFDLMHTGHVAYLEFARNHGDKLIVALSSDRMARLRKGDGRPIQPFDDRKKVLEAIRFVDGCIEAPHPTNNLITNLLDSIKIIQPDVFVSTYREFETKHTAFFKEKGVKLVIVPNFSGNTTTKIITKIVKSYDKNKT